MRKGLRIAKLRGCEDNIKTELDEVGRHGVEWINLAHNGCKWRALITTVINFGFNKMGRTY
jgi:hypothetical protein